MSQVPKASGGTGTLNSLILKFLLLTARPMSCLREGREQILSIYSAKSVNSNLALLDSRGNTFIAVVPLII